MTYENFYLQPNYRLELTARLFLAERPQLSRSVGQTGFGENPLTLDRDVGILVV
jgi:hypothetical protein